MAERGKFITIEGIEGTGKSTNIRFLVDWLTARGIDVTETREPGGTPLAERIRGVLLDVGEEPVSADAELMLFFAARSLHLQNLIVPALEQGNWVVCDRFTDATRAYQGYGRGLDLGRIERLAEWVHGGTEPELTLLLDAPAEVGVGRTRSRGAGDRMDNETLDFYRRVREGYLALADAEPSRFTVIDASGDLATVQAGVVQALQPLFHDK